MLESTEKGGVRNSIHNCLTVFQYDPELSGAVAKNLLTERIDMYCTLPHLDRWDFASGGSCLVAPYPHRG